MPNTKCFEFKIHKDKNCVCNLLLLYTIILYQCLVFRKILINLFSFTIEASLFLSIVKSNQIWVYSNIEILIKSLFKNKQTKQPPAHLMFSSGSLDYEEKNLLVVYVCLAGDQKTIKASFWILRESFIFLVATVGCYLPTAGEIFSDKVS